MNEFIKVIKNYAGFSGRAARKEFWMFYLVYILIYIGLAILAAIVTFSLSATLGSALGLASFVLLIGLIIPTIAVGVRRLHDTDHSGWWLLLSIVPFAGLYILYLFVIQGTVGANRYGESPIAIIENAV